jgi:hypothetical protein
MTRPRERPPQGTQAEPSREPHRVQQGQERYDNRQETPQQGRVTPPLKRAPQGAQAQQPGEPQRAQQGHDQRAPQAHEQQRSGSTQQQPPQSIGARQSRRTEHQERITPQPAVENRFSGQVLRQPDRRDQWLAARRAHWAPGEAWRHKRRAVFVPWFGPLYWPYAYSDVFHYTFWPYAYSETFWPFAYDDFFDGIFFPYGAPYVANAYSGPYGDYTSMQRYDPGASIYYGSRKRSTGQTAPIGSVSKAARELCEKPDTGITAWPIQQISETLQPSDDQRALLDDLRNAGAEAADVFRKSCPKSVPMTPVSRLLAMIGRLQATLDAVDLVRPALERFYDSLSDEQRARLNVMQSDVGQQAGQATPEQQRNACINAKPGLADLPIDRIDEVVQPMDDQEDALSRLSDATQKAVEVIQAACRDSTPLTPVGRIGAMNQRLNAMLTAVETIQPTLEDFYSSLNNEQKARFNTLDRDLARGS